jgi:hypothetical protein
MLTHVASALAGRQTSNASDPTTMGTMLALFRTLSPQQLTPEQLLMLQQIGAPEPMRIEQPCLTDILMGISSWVSKLGPFSAVRRGRWVSTAGRLRTFQALRNLSLNPVNDPAKPRGFTFHRMATLP